MSQKITLINDNNIISESSEIAKIFNEYFCTVATKLNIEDSLTHITDTQNISDPILKAIKKYENHPSRIKITENIITKEVFKFSHASCKDIGTVVNSLNISKATICRNIPTKVFTQNFDICSGVINSVYNSCIIVPNFPSNMKYANINPVHKKDDYTDKNNYRPVSLLPVVSKVFEGLMHNDISLFMDKYLSNRLWGVVLNSV